MINKHLPLYLFLFILFLEPVRAQDRSEIFWTLEETIRRALKKNPQLSQSKERVVQAELEEPRLLANTDPTLFGHWQQSEDWSPTVSPPILGTRTIDQKFGFGWRQKWLTGTRAQIAWRSTRADSDSIFRPINPTHTENLELNVRQPLLKDFWGRPDKALRKKARANVKSIEGRYLQAAQELTVRVSEAYFNFSFALEELKIKEKSVGDLEKLLAKQKEKRSYGVTEESDLLQTQAALKLKKLEAQAARTQIRIARNALLTLLSESEKGEAILPVQSRAAFEEKNPLELDESEALARRPDLAAAKAKVEALKSELRATELSALPTLDFVSRYGMASLGDTFSKASGDLSERGKPFYAIGLEAEIPLFRKVRKVDLRLAHSELRDAETNLAYLLDRARQEFGESKELYLLAVAKKEAQKEILELQKKKWIEEEKNFQRGRSTTDILIRFQADWDEAERLLIKAELDERLAAIQWQAAAGALMDYFSLTHD